MRSNGILPPNGWVTRSPGQMCLHYAYTTSKHIRVQDATDGDHQSHSFLCGATRIQINTTGCVVGCPGVPAPSCGCAASCPNVGPTLYEPSPWEKKFVCVSLWLII